MVRNWSRKPGRGNARGFDSFTFRQYKLVADPDAILNVPPAEVRRMTDELAQRHRDLMDLRMRKAIATGRRSGLFT